MTSKAGLRKWILGTGALVLTGAVAWAATTWNDGDLFLGIAGGQYQVRDQAGALKETISTGRGGFTTGCAFDSDGNLYVTEFSANQVSVFAGPDDPHTNTTFGGGYSTPEMVAFDSAGNVYVGNLGGGIRQFQSDGTFIKTIAPGVRVDFFDIAADQDTIAFGQENNSILTASISTGLQGPNFATGTAAQAYAMRFLPDGGLLLANGANVQRYNSAGAVIDTYDATGENSWFALNLDPDGTSFWAGDFGTSNYYKFDIDTGGADTYIGGPFNTGTGSGTFFGLCVQGEPTAGGGDEFAVAKTYRHTNVCFERDNDGDGMISEDAPDFLDNDLDGLFDEDGSECPDGTNPGDEIANDGEGTYTVESVLKKNGSVSSYNPGQLYAVLSVNILKPLDNLILGEFYQDCTMDPPDLLDLNPTKGGGRAKVIVEHGDGTLEQVFDANTDNPDVAFSSDEDETSVAWDADFEAGDIVHLYVKFGPGKNSTGDDSCDNLATAATEIDVDEFAEKSAEATLVVVPK